MLLRRMPVVHAWIVLMPLASTTAYRPNITKLVPQTMETKRLKESYGRVYEALKLHTEQTFLGVRFGQNPSDAQVIQEIVSEVKPALIIETGTNTGGSALWLSVLLEAVRPSAKIVTIDPTHIEEWIATFRSQDPRKSPFWERRVIAINGLSTDDSVHQRVKALAAEAAGPVLFICDSTHKYDTTHDELRLYTPLVTVGSYAIVQDTDKFPRGAARAADEFIRAARQGTWLVDRSREYLVFTEHTRGYLKRLAADSNLEAPVKRLQFLHVTKSAGTAIEQWGARHGFQWGSHHPLLQPSSSRPSKFVRVQINQAETHMERFHAPPSILAAESRGNVWSRDHLLRDVLPYNSSYVFCVARHPVCRAISEFRCPWKGASHGESFTSWLHKRARLVAGEAPTMAHGLPLTPWYVGACDTVLRFEHLQHDFTELIRWADPALVRANESAATLPVVNEARSLRYALTPHDLNFIFDIYQADFEHFNYSLSAIPCPLDSSGRSALPFRSMLDGDRSTRQPKQPFPAHSLAARLPRCASVSPETTPQSAIKQCRAKWKDCRKVSVQKLCPEQCCPTLSASPVECKRRQLNFIRPSSACKGETNPSREAYATMCAKGASSDYVRSKLKVWAESIRRFDQQRPIVILLPHTVVHVAKSWQEEHVSTAVKRTRLLQELAELNRSVGNVHARVLDRSDDVMSRVPSALRSVMDTPFINCCGAREMRVLSVWGLQEYERVLYMEADTQLQQTVDELFRCDLEFISALGLWAPLNGGVFFLRPSLARLGSLLNTLQNVSYSDHDGWGGCGWPRPHLPGWAMPFGGETMQGFLEYYWHTLRPESSAKFDVGMYNFNSECAKLAEMRLENVTSDMFKTCMLPAASQAQRVKVVHKGVLAEVTSEARAA